MAVSGICDYQESFTCLLMNNTIILVYSLLLTLWWSITDSFSLDNLNKVAFRRNSCTKSNQLRFLSRLYPVSMINTESSDDIIKRAQYMNERAIHESPFTDDELDGIIRSVRKIYPTGETLDFDKLRTFLSQVAHLSHKDWERTGKNSETLASIIIPDGISENARHLFTRIFRDGNWDGAINYVTKRKPKELPWAVLVTGVNGIRKTTSMYQDWFPSLLSEALIAPGGFQSIYDVHSLPCGQTAFFRQLGT
jgi:hypothetical protein